ncbi:T9SS-dependent choice-of-anchor J family protein [Flavobacterium psychrotolerans]|uniref:Fibronectin type-III domain-containing protein n=1 Tax=Flavobacterium psychrotolerans TaxID=2169410 RepID=A0A2U1JMT4_9FLAO|nr:choice-of-anchor J domain-containing protein [Flavobacterium psychrotolerans]PWA06168.1 hypothetical protein DB895_04515 [Flavobacterium psychrotolerans]
MKKITLLFMLFIGFSAFAQFPQDFEGTFPPTGWAVYRGANDLGIESDWTATTVGVATGLQAAYVDYEAVTAGELAEDWLVSPAYTVTAPNTLMAFYQGQDDPTDYGSTYTIRVSTTSQIDINSFTIVDTQTESDFTIEMTTRTVDLSAYAGQTIYIAFVLENNEGDAWAIDGIDFISNTVIAPGCVSNPSPADAALEVPIGATTFSWTAPTTGGPVTLYNIYSGATSDAVTDFITSTTTPSVDLSLADFSTTFYWKVVAVNLVGSATDCAVWSFTTQSPPGYCLAASGGQYPADAYTPEILDGVTENIIVSDGFAGEYSVVNVLSGQTYTFTSGTTDFITIGNEAGDTSLIAGASPLTWVSDISGVIRFYSHVDDQCGEENIERPRTVISDPLLATDTFNSASFHTFPNPVKDILNISYDKNISNVAVFNLLGQEVMTKSVKQNQSQVDMSHLSNGTYMVKVTSDNQVKTIKVIKG